MHDLFHSVKVRREGLTRLLRISKLSVVELSGEVPRIAIERLR